MEPETRRALELRAQQLPPTDGENDFDVDSFEGPDGLALDGEEWR